MVTRLIFNNLKCQGVKLEFSQHQSMTKLKAQSAQNEEFPKEVPACEKGGAGRVRDGGEQSL